MLLLAAAASARPVRVERVTSVLRFEYQWSAEAAAIKRLNQELRATSDALYRRATGDARDDYEAAVDTKRPFHRHSYEVSWKTVGQTARLLSIAARIDSFTGGAHPNHNVDAQLWDRRFGRRIVLSSLFIHPAAFEKLTRAAYCRALDKERRSRRGGEQFDGPFGECPKYADLAIAPRDRRPNGRFETIAFIAAPYTAGPYVEGQYAIDLPVTRHLIAAIKPVYRRSFEVQRQ
jgi:hypothetical protein